MKRRRSRAVIGRGGRARQKKGLTVQSERRTFAIFSLGVAAMGFSLPGGNKADALLS